MSRAEAPTPLQGAYPAAVAMALLALCPYIVLSTASLLLQQQLVADLATSGFGVQLAGALANAGYAFGAVAAADLIQRVAKRVLFIACEAVFASMSLVCALAPDVVVFVIGRLGQGISTGMLLVVALPPLVTAHGVRRLPLTAAFVNLGLFGMVTAGPLVGGAVAAQGEELAWRALFAGVGVLGLAGAGVGALAFSRDPAPDRDAGFDYSAIPVAAAATALPFIGVSWLSRGSFAAPGFLIPTALGLAALATLLVRQYRKKQALMPLRLITHTFPVTGVLAAMVAGAAFTALIELSATFLLMARQQQPMAVGALLAPQIVGVLVAAWLFKRVLTTRFLPLLTFSGLAVVAVGGVLVVLSTTGGGRQALTLVAVAGLLLGFGAGAGVSPGLFMAGLSVESNRLGPTFALVELLRAEAAFLVAPILLRIAMSAGGLAAGVRMAALAAVVLTVVIGLGLLALLALGGVRPHEPDLAGWLAGDESAFDSPRLAAVIRDD